MFLDIDKFLDKVQDKGFPEGKKIKPEQEHPTACLKTGSRATAGKSK